MLLAIRKSLRNVRDVTCKRSIYFDLTLQNGWTPLIYASSHGQLGLVHKLCDNEANVDDQTKVEV